VTAPAVKVLTLERPNLLPRWNVGARENRREFIREDLRDSSFFLLFAD